MSGIALDKALGKVSDNVSVGLSRVGRIRESRNVQKSFESVLDGERSLRKVADFVSSNFSKPWIDAEKKYFLLSQRLPESAKALLEVQRRFNELSLRTQMIIKAAESLNSSVRRLEQGQ